MKNKNIVVIAVLILVAIAALWFFTREQVSISDELETAIQEAQLPASLQEFYAARAYEGIWNKGAKPSNQAEDMAKAILHAKYEGLNPKDYYADELSEFLKEKKQEKFESLNTDEVVKLDFLLSQAFLKLVSDLEVGIVDPYEVDGNWKLELKEAKLDPMALLAEVADGKSVEDALDVARPDLELYKEGKKVLENLYAKLDSDTLKWNTVRLDKTLEVGESHESIPALRERLVYWGLLDSKNLSESIVFDETMEESLKQFQKANGMGDDGKIGNMTVAALNNSTQDLIDVAAVNMERLRWLPELPWNEEMVFVNIANFELEYMQDGDTTLSAKIIVGKEYNESPVFTAPMSYIVFSPYWNIPESITKGEIIPAYRQNSNYLTEKRMEVVSASGEVVSPKSVNWNVKSGESMPFRVRQRPGGDNSLGLVKFMFPNEYNIYIHDTPASSLFARENRALSHGCVRIENPAFFAKTLLQDDSWDDEKIENAMHQSEEVVVNLSRDVPVVILYMTFWADANGRAHFREDIYNRDAKVLKALRTS